MNAPLHLDSLTGDALHSIDNFTEPSLTQYVNTIDATVDKLVGNVPQDNLTLSISQLANGVSSRDWYLRYYFDSLAKMDIEAMVTRSPLISSPEAEASFSSWSHTNETTRKLLSHETLLRLKLAHMYATKRSVQLDALRIKSEEDRLKFITIFREQNKNPPQTHIFLAKNPDYIPIYESLMNGDNYINSNEKEQFARTYIRYKYIKETKRDTELLSTVYEFIESSPSQETTVVEENSMGTQNNIVGDQQAIKNDTARKSVILRHIFGNEEGLDNINIFEDTKGNVLDEARKVRDAIGKKYDKYIGAQLTKFDAYLGYCPQYTHGEERMAYKIILTLRSIGEKMKKEDSIGNKIKNVRSKIFNFLGFSTKK